MTVEDAGAALALRSIRVNVGGSRSSGKIGLRQTRRSKFMPCTIGLCLLALAIHSMAFGFIESMMSASFNDPTYARACAMQQWI
jgi:hypothetical protein